MQVLYLKWKSMMGIFLMYLKRLGEVLLLNTLDLEFWASTSLTVPSGHCQKQTCMSHLAL